MGYTHYYKGLFECNGRMKHHFHLLLRILGLPTDGTDKERLFAQQDWQNAFREYVESTVVNYTGLPEIYEEHLCCPTCGLDSSFLIPIILDRECLKKPPSWQDGKLCLNLRLMKCSHDLLALCR